MFTNDMILGWSPGKVMSPEQIKVFYKRLYYEVWNKGDLNAVRLLYPSDIKSIHVPRTPWSTQDLVSPEQIVTICRTALPDLYVSIEEQILEGDSFVTRWTALGTHTRALLDIPPTGKLVTVTGITIRHLFIDHEGRALSREMWVNWDTSSTNEIPIKAAVTQRCTIQAGKVDNFHGLFFAETADGSFQVAHSDKTFTGGAATHWSDAQEALEDLVNKLKAGGWQQVGTSPSPWYNLTFERQIPEESSIETCIVKAGESDNVHGLFFAETADGSFQVAHSDKTFFGNAVLPAPDAQEALEDLVNKLKAGGWQQVVGTLPSPWYQLTFQRQIPEESSIETCIVKAGEHDIVHGLFFAETADGSFQVAQSDKTFFGNAVLPAPDAQEALKDLINQLKAGGWQQVVGTLPSPWYQLTFQRLKTPGERKNLGQL
jgi:hypothetical protein